MLCCAVHFVKGMRMYGLQGNEVDLLHEFVLHVITLNMGGSPGDVSEELMT